MRCPRHPWYTGKYRVRTDDPCAFCALVYRDAHPAPVLPLERKMEQHPLRRLLRRLLRRDV